MEKDTYEDLDDPLTHAKVVAEAPALTPGAARRKAELRLEIEKEEQRRADLRASRLAEIAADQRRIENHDEGARIAAEEKAHRAMGSRRWHDYGEREYEWNQLHATADLPTDLSVKPNPLLQSVLDEIASWPEMSIQPHLWENRIAEAAVPTKLDSSVVGPKQEALVWYAQNLKKLPGRAWQVLICLWNASPTDFTLFTISHEEISKTTAIAICFIPNAVKDLEENGLILVVRKRRSKKLHPRNRYALVPPTKLDSSVVRQSSIRAEASDSRA